MGRKWVVNASPLIILGKLSRLGETRPGRATQAARTTRSRRSWWTWHLWPSAAFLLVCLVAPSHAVAERVARVIDGDTILLEDGRKVRYAGINAPEEGDTGPKRARRPSPSPISRLHSPDPNSRSGSGVQVFCGRVPSCRRLSLSPLRVPHGDPGISPVPVAPVFVILSLSLSLSSLLIVPVSVAIGSRYRCRFSLFLSLSLSFLSV